MPSFARCSGVVYVMVRPLSRTTPRAGVPSPAMTRRIVDLPAPLVPSSASTSPLRDLEAHVEEHLHGPVREVDVGDLQGGDLRRRFLLAPVLGHLLPELGDDEGEVVADEVRAAEDQQPADDRRRDDDHEHRGARPELVGEQAGEERAAGRADEEDVDRPERRAHAAQPVRHHRLQDRPHHRERRSTAGSAAGSPRIVNAMTLGMKNCTGVRIAAGRISHPTNRSARAGSRR